MNPVAMTVLVSLVVGALLGGAAGITYATKKFLANPPSFYKPYVPTSGHCSNCGLHIDEHGKGEPRRCRRSSS